MEKVKIDSQKDKIKKIQNTNAFFRQELKNLTPNCNLKCSLICNLILIIIFVVAGIAIIINANNIIEIQIPYTNW
jgi:hypothetical protein